MNQWWFFLFLFVSKVWPGTTAFPDFTHPNVTEWWTNIAEKFHQIIPFDGMWIVRIDYFILIFNHINLGYE